MYSGLWLPESNPPFAFPSVAGFCVWPVNRPLENGGGDFAIGHLHQVQLRISTFSQNWQQTAGRHRIFKNKAPVVTLTMLRLSAGGVHTTFSFGVSSGWWWASFLCRTSECFSRWEWGRQSTDESLMDSAAAKRLDSADTHSPRESRERTMATHEWWPSTARFVLETDDKAKANTQSQTCKCASSKTPLLTLSAPGRWQLITSCSYTSPPVVWLDPITFSVWPKEVWLLLHLYRLNSFYWPLSEFCLSLVWLISDVINW